MDQEAPWRRLLQRNQKEEEFSLKSLNPGLLQSLGDEASHGPLAPNTTASRV